MRNVYDDGLKNTWRKKWGTSSSFLTLQISYNLTDKILALKEIQTVCCEDKTTLNAKFIEFKQANDKIKKITYKKGNRNGK